MHKVAVIHLREGKKSKIKWPRTAFTDTKIKELACGTYFSLKAAPDLDFPHEVSELHIILNDEVCIKTFGRDAVLLLQSWTVANSSTGGAPLDVSGGRGVYITCGRKNVMSRQQLLICFPAKI